MLTKYQLFLVFIVTLLSGSVMFLLGKKISRWWLILFVALLAVGTCWFYNWVGGSLIESSVNSKGIWFEKQITITISAVSAFSIVFAAISLISQLEKSRQDSNERDRDIRREGFEKKFYERLRMLKTDQNDISINRKTGHKAFEQLYLEFKYVMYVLKRITDTYGDFNFTDEIRIKLCYSIVFSGLDKTGVLEIPQDHEEKTYEWYYKKLQTELYSEKMQLLKEGSSKIYDHNNNTDVVKAYDSIFTGHQSQLGHYYRQLFHLVSFVVKTPDFTWEEKYDYIKIIRSQLSNHEQTFLFFNACWEAKGVWWLDEDTNGNKYRYFLDYAIVKNVPPSLTSDIGVNIEEIFREKLQNFKAFKKGDNTHNIDEKLAWLFEEKVF